MQFENYHQNGILYVEQFLNRQTLLAITHELEAIQNENSSNKKKVFFYSKNPLGDKNKFTDYATTDYFLESSDKAHLFYELREGKEHLNRIGHGLHLLQNYKSIPNLIYNHNTHNSNYSHNSQLIKLLKMAGYRRPICHLSVYIPKHPMGVGSDVRPHQESTFALTHPYSVTVLWIALEDAMIENACMWGIPGSHLWPLKYISCVQHDPLAENRKREFIKISEVNIPEFSRKSPFVPLEVKQGDALFFHGQFVHCSPINNSNRSRACLTFQFIESHDVVYPPTNWLQPLNQKYIYDLVGEI